MSTTNNNNTKEEQQASSSSPLPPISSLPNSIYPPSSYPPPSYFSSSTTLQQPALIIPAKRTGEIIKLLSDEDSNNIVYSEKKCKRVYGVEVGTDYDESDVVEGYNPKNERKLVLKSLGTATSGPLGKVDQVYYDERIMKLVEEDHCDDKTTTEDGFYSSQTAPPGRISIRPSYINLPSNLSYNILTVDQVLTRILPTNQNINEIPSSFEIAGHIAHVNLRSEVLPYKYLIGKAILDKNSKTIKLVVNKIGNIENEYRTFPMEIIAGDGLDVDVVEKLCNTPPPGDDSSNEVQIKVESPQHDKLMIVQVKEHGCKFTLDFANVYFNSRLQSEHNRLVQYIMNDASKNKKKKECTIVADAMAGVGPFAIPLTSSNTQHCQSSKIICHANDLNPTSYKYLLQNGQTNKCQKDKLYTYNLDGREFIHKMNAEGTQVDHYIMNLPQMAPEFLNAFRGYKFHSGDEDRPMVHVHCFGEKPRLPQDVSRIERTVQERCEVALGCPNCFLNGKNDVNIRIVRDVGPRKNMLCVSFRLPVEVGNVDKIVLDKSGDKRQRSEDDDTKIDTKRSKE